MDLLQSSLVASPLILVIILVRLLCLYQLPKRTFKILWMTVIVRLLFPYSLPSRFSIFNIFPVQTQTPLIITYSADGATPSLAAATSSHFTFSLWNILWLLGCLAVAFFFLRAHIKNRMKFIDSDKLEHPNLTLWFQANTIRRPMRIRFSDQISSPLTYGVFMPVILLPQDIDLNNEQQLRFILTHEYIHLCRFDALIKAALAVVLSIHWFNPLVWIMFMLANRDIELTCDEGVLRTLGFSKREAYAYLLINMSASHAASPSVINHFSNNSLEERVLAIMRLKKKRFASALFGILLAAGILVVFATDEKRFVYEFIEEEESFSSKGFYLNMIRRFSFYQTKAPSNTYWKQKAVSLNDAAVKEYEEAIPELIASGLVSEKAAQENLKNLSIMLTGEPVDFHPYDPYIYVEHYDSNNDYWSLQIMLHNGEYYDPYYYALPIVVIE